MTGLIAERSKTLRVQEFRASGQFTVPAGVKTVSLFLVGAGGGSVSNTAVGIGGNIVEVNYDVSGKASCAVIIGAGTSGNGGTTSFDGVVIAIGGKASVGVSSTFASAYPGGKKGFGGHAVPTANILAMPGNGANSIGAPAANSGAGAIGPNSSTGENGASGYARVEWYE